MLDKIRLSKVKKKPFEFIYIDNFLSIDDLNMIISHSSFKTSGNNFEELCSQMDKKGWTPHPHPGTFKDLESYKTWRKNNYRLNEDIYGHNEINKLCEGSGMAFRLSNLPEFLSELRNLFLSEDFIDCIKNKFSLNDNFKYKIDCGFQKYLSGYEISPHPDVREKALTWMLNLNLNEKSENENYHTHLMKFKLEKSYIYEIWNNYTNIQRPWVPWSWCQTEFMHSKNNSITIFSPNSYTLHAIKAEYNDLIEQRTQLYGNIWYDMENSKNMPYYLESNHENLDYEKVVNASLKKSRLKNTSQKFIYFFKNPLKLLKKFN
ncbi:hypothetical protein CU305_07870 [Prochlorococcus marinus str. MU1416]|nr:hypothetical protein [Prochlorococcus marinus str. MU1416]